MTPACAFLSTLLSLMLATGAMESAKLPSIVLDESDHGDLLALPDGGLALIERDGRIQFRSPDGNWSKLVRLPLSSVDCWSVAADEKSVLLAGQKESLGGDNYVVLVGTDGQVRQEWRIANFLTIFSLASWKGRHWVMGPTMRFEGKDSRGAEERGLDKRLLELMPGGKIEERHEIPPVLRTVHLADGEWSGKPIPIIPKVEIYFTPTGERVYCAPGVCEHDGPCYSGACYRRDVVEWEKFADWNNSPVPCGNYLLETEQVIDPYVYPRHKRNRTVVRRMADGAEIAAVKVTKDSLVTCGVPDEEILVADTSARSYHLATGKRAWTVAVHSGVAVAVARAKDCVIVLTNKGKQQSICREPPRMPRQSE